MWAWLRRTARRLVMLAVSFLWLALILLRIARRDHVLVLCFHAVTDDQRARFERQLRALRGRAAPLDVIDDAAVSAAPPRVCVTFDDAFACLLRNALPAAAAHGVPVCIFAVTGNLGERPRWRMRTGHPEAGERLMTCDELLEARDRFGCRIGSHTRSHPSLPHIPPGQADEELQASRAELEAVLGTPIYDFAAPYGAYSEEAVAAARRAGYRRFFSLDRALRPYPRVTGRYLVSPDAWSPEFVLLINGGYGWVEPARRAWDRFKGQPASVDGTSRKRTAWV
jgi:peptidoglycan/xylan/chitin deacetylase (PgdA/CDA1 family)